MMFTKISLTFFAASAGLLLSSSSSAVEASSFNVRGSRERGDHGLQESAPDDNRLIILDSNDEENGKELEPQKHGRDLLTLSGDEIVFTLLDIVKLNDELITPFASSLVPALVSFVNAFANNELRASASGGFCCVPNPDDLGLDQACLGVCTAAFGTCMVAFHTCSQCAPACDVARQGCRGACTGVFETCNAGCEAAFGACEACNFVVPFADPCGNCNSFRNDCRNGCNSARNSCNSGCDSVRNTCRSACIDCGGIRNACETARTNCNDGCDFACPGEAEAEVFAFVRDFHMSDIGPETISISTSESSDGARFRFAVNDLQAGFNEVGAGFDINACSLFDFGCMAGISISLKLHEFSFEMELINGGDYLAIVPQSVNLDFDLDIDPQYDGSICDAASFIVNEIESLLDIAGAGLEVLVDLASEFLGAINQLMGPLNVPIPEVTVPILEGNNLTFIPQMKELRSSSVELAASVSASFRGVLTTPDWRTGNYSVFSVVPDDTAVSPVLENQANFNVFDSGLNTLIRAVWYVVWATLATDQLAQGSELCEPSPGDPCPFPPFIAKHTGLQRILLRTVFPLSIGIFRSYRSSILLSPPSLKFETDIVSGSTSATIIVEGVRRNGEVVKLTDITAPVTVKGSLPDYDVESGKLSDLKITSFEIGELVPGDGRYRARPLFRLVRRAINGIVRLLVSRVNDAIDKELASQSLKLPTIKDFPLKDEGLSLLVDLLAVNLDAVAASATTSSFLNLDGSIAAAILTDSGARIAPPVFSKPTGFDSESLRLSVYDEMVGKAWTEQNSNKTYAFYYHREEDDIKTFTTIRYDEDSGEVLEKNGDSWVPLA